MRIIVLMILLSMPLAMSIAQEQEAPTSLNIPALIKALEDGDWKVSYDASYQAAQMLGDLGPAAREAIPALIRVVKDKDNERVAPVVRHKAAWALGRMGSNARPAIPALEQTFQGNDYYLQVQGAIALNAIQPSNSKVVPQLIKLLDYQHPHIRREAADALANISPAPTAALPKLQSMVADSDQDVRSAALIAIQTIQTETKSRSGPPGESR